MQRERAKKKKKKQTNEIRNNKPTDRDKIFYVDSALRTNR